MGVAQSQFRCPESNGRFPDPEQCDKYYLCRKGVAEELLCPEGLLFDYKVVNREKCVLPQNVDCGDRLKVQERSPTTHPRCKKANGFFNHDDPLVCDKYINCDKGTPFEMPCVQTLLFDEKAGTCVRKESLSKEARRCDKDKYLEIDGFTCEGTEAIGPQGLLQQHPIYPHPTDCRSYFTCYFGEEPNKFGCSDGNVFDTISQQCKDPALVPECSCYYECYDDCPKGCYPNCECKE